MTYMILTTTLNLPYITPKLNLFQGALNSPLKEPCKSLGSGFYDLLQTREGLKSPIAPNGTEREQFPGGGLETGVRHQLHGLCCPKLWGVGVVWFCRELNSCQQRFEVHLRYRMLYSYSKSMLWEGGNYSGSHNTLLGVVVFAFRPALSSACFFTFWVVL